jgi:hypothetical protein
MRLNLLIGHNPLLVTQLPISFDSYDRILFPLKSQMDYVQAQIDPVESCTQERIQVQIRRHTVHMNLPLPINHYRVANSLPFAATWRITLDV